MSKSHSFPSVYRSLAFNYWGKKCDDCGSTNNLTIHHLNNNPHDNKVFNLKVLCVTCHEKRHSIKKKTSNIKKRTLEGKNE